MRKVSFRLPDPTGEVGALVKQEAVLPSLESGSFRYIKIQLDKLNFSFSKEAYCK